MLSLSHRLYKACFKGPDSYQYVCPNIPMYVSSMNMYVESTYIVDVEIYFPLFLF